MHRQYKEKKEDVQQLMRLKEKKIIAQQKLDQSRMEMEAHNMLTPSEPPPVSSSPEELPVVTKLHVVEIAASHRPIHGVNCGASNGQKMQDIADYLSQKACIIFQRMNLDEYLTVVSNRRWWHNLKLLKVSPARSAVY